MKKKILMVVEAFGGGVFFYMADLANALAEQFDIYIAYSLRPQTPRDFPEYFDPRIQLIEVKNFGRSINLFRDAKAFFEVRRIAEKISPDLIHLHSAKAGAIGRWCLNGKKIPLFYTPHGYTFLMENQSPANRILFQAIERLSSLRRCTTISCSKGEHDETLRLTKRAVRIDNGINVRNLKRDMENSQVRRYDSFCVCTVGRICTQKNPSLFNEIAAVLPHIHFLWIGDGELREQLTALNIEITGWLERKDVISAVLGADAFLLTSLLEGLPISLLEAMYMRKPCVVSNAIGNRDVIRDRENGFVCSCLQDYVQAIQDIGNGGADGMVERAFQDVMGQYNIDIMSKKYRDVYEKALGG